MTQLDLFPHENVWCKQRQEWWDLHGFRPKAGCLVLITGAGLYYGLEGYVLDVDKERDSIVVEIREYPECPWIEQKVLTLRYYGVDPILYESGHRPKQCDLCMDDEE